MATFALDTPTVIAVLVILLLAYKNLPWVWHFRFIRTLLTRLFITPVTIDQLSPECLFLPAIHRTRSPVSECDYNIHKSNSTYFTDMDISRGNLSLLLFSQRLSFRPTHNTAVMILSGVQCVFHREIKPYQPFEVWSRVLSWDEKWIYIVTHFVVRGAYRPKQFCLQKDSVEIPSRSREHGDAVMQEKKRRSVFASAVSRYVFKQGRKTFPPENMLKECGLLPSTDAEMGSNPTGPDQTKTSHLIWREIEARRKRDLEVAQLKLGWDGVNNCFEGEIHTALGRYTDLLWR
ncbi:hypothetical protein PENARI_c005G01374 [Penicillium arizonense]|uniref:Thioesterase domain-containing protein n=1 Tax=Penicillium arizonense TaxID=1835702 RepID=A0A1F5LPY5_PENAI|nr:hypothetical protein PENARI_c005G01374 [Penicillium arizonense]OGE54961.1 hypothetical protein PENARI_c005G01374 [Penicillium arizonense]